MADEAEKVLYVGSDYLVALVGLGETDRKVIQSELTKLGEDPSNKNVVETLKRISLFMKSLSVSASSDPCPWTTENRPEVRNLWINALKALVEAWNSGHSVVQAEDLEETEY